jgi:DNA-binding MarR family transcriptional regulator
MPNKKNAPADATPAGRLHEARLHQVLGYQLAQASIATTSVFKNQVGDAYDLRPVEYTILGLINENPGGSPARLAKALAVSAPNITVWIDRLAKRGLVERQPSEVDRRAQLLRTTAEGARIANEATQRLLDGEGEAFAGLSAGERLMLVELLHKLACARPG